mgnify:CR=1 FL=1
MRTISVCLWRVLNAYVEEAHQSVDLSDLTQVGSDELSYRKRHKYVTVFADMEQNRGQGNFI